MEVFENRMNFQGYLIQLFHKKEEKRREKRIREEKRRSN
jgi:hypothetical protein